MAGVRIILFIGAMGAVGAISRYALSNLLLRWLGGGFPYGTLAVNVLGCFLLGGLSQIGLTSDLVPESWRLALGVGLLGGLTTFSTFGHETFRHLEAGNLHVAGGNVVANLCFGLTAVWAGVTVARLVQA